MPVEDQMVGDHRGAGPLTVLLLNEPPTKRLQEFSQPWGWREGEVEGLGVEKYHVLSQSGERVFKVLGTRGRRGPR